MSGRFDASGDALTRSADLPVVPLTAMLWGKISVDRNAYSTFIRLGGSGGSSSTIMDTFTDGTTFNIWNGSGDVNNGTQLTVGQWYHLAIVYEGTGANQIRGYINGVLDISTSGSAGVNQVLLGALDTSGTEQLNGCIEGVKIYNMALSERRIKEESKQIWPVNWNKLVIFTTFRTVEEFVINKGGSNGLWTASGSLTLEQGPPVPWVLPSKKRVYFVPGGAQLYQLSLSSSVTPTTNVVKLGGKVLNSGVTPSTSLSKVVGKAVSSVVTPVTNVLIVVGKVLNSGVTPISSVVKVVNKNVSSVVGVVTNLSKVVVKGSFNSSVIPVSNVIKIAVKSLSSLVTPVTSVVISVTRALVLSSVVTPVSTMVKVVSKGLSSSVGVSSEVSKVVGKAVSSEVTPISGVVKVVNKVVSSVVIPTSSLVYSAIKALFLSSSVTPVTSIVKVGVKGLSSVVGVGSSMSKVVGKVLGSGVTPTSQMVKMFLQYIVLDSFVTPVTSIVTQFIGGSGLPSLNSLLPIFRRRRK